MAMTALALPPGVDTQASKLAAVNRWNSSNLIRFKDGHLQKLGGCQRIAADPLVGICRGLHAWEDLGGASYLAAGTDQRLQVMSLGVIADITPVDRTVTLSNPFTTVYDSAVVTVTDANHDRTTGDWIIISGASAVAGITLSGFYQITVLTADTYTVTDTSTASAGTTGGGSPTIQYLLGSDITQTALAYGQGNYGAGPYSYGGLYAIGFLLRQWSLDNWGQDLVGCPTNGPPYLWVPPVAAGNVAAPIAGTGVPLFLTGLYVAMPEQQIFGFGAETGGVQDPLLIRWCDVGDYTDWTASATNQAGSFRLSSGSRIVGGLQTTQSSLFWTDLDLWVAQYLGFPLVWGFNKVGINCGLVGMRAAAQTGSIVLWMGQSQFFLWNGASVAVLPCSVWDFVFNNLDRNYLDAVTAASNSLFAEVTWYFPTVGSQGVADAYVKYNVASQCWDYGTLTRSAWIDENVFGPPIGIDANGYIQQHETANDLDGVAMDSWAESGWFEISAGTVAVFLERLIPDLILSSGATVLVTVQAADFVGDAGGTGAVRTYGPFTVSAQTPWVIVRARGRFASIKVESQGPNSFWRLGMPLYSTQQAGRRTG